MSCRPNERSECVETSPCVVLGQAWQNVRVCVVRGSLRYGLWPPVGMTSTLWVLVRRIWISIEPLLSRAASGT
ncbi:hypothetical protein [Rhodohalobacter mucosus]|uniref:hypothetical protein n=1 Tax=Rhodohalobacter mucosus TaxID=2079485 RepID=UPI0011B2164E|nr:hypothetical protein [Rhodohalobacter mucosus]